MSHEEYSIIMLKPDGNSTMFIRFLQRYLARLNVSTICSKEVMLTEQEVEVMFPTNYNQSLYKEYLTQGPCKFLLVRGESAYDILTDYKYDIRHSFNVNSTDMRNLLHTPEAGNEYTTLLKTFFKDIDSNKYALPYDTYAKVSFNNGDDLIKRIEANADVTNASLIYVFKPDELASIDANFFQTIVKQTNDFSLYGIEYCVTVNNTSLSIIGYYRILDTNKYDERCGVECSNVYDLIRRIKEHNGVPCAGYLNDSFTVDMALFKFFSEIGIRNVLCYHPDYSIKETVNIRRNLLDNNLGMLGGSAGKSNLGEYGISRGLFESAFKDLIMPT